MSIERDVLLRYPTIAVVGISNEPSRPAYWVSEYMREQGYRIIPVNPLEETVFGERCYPDLESIPEPVQFVNVFRRPEFCAEVAREAVAAGAETLWLQLGIVSPEARRIAEAAGLTYIEDRCVLAEHRRHHLGRITGQPSE